MAGFLSNLLPAVGLEKGKTMEALIYSTLAVVSIAAVFGPLWYRAKLRRDRAEGKTCNRQNGDAVERS